MQKLLAVALATAFAATSAQAAPHAHPHPHKSKGAASILVTQQPHGSVPVLYDQLSTAVQYSGLLATEDSSSDDYDSEGADDFVVTDAAGWTITGFTFNGEAYDGESDLDEWSTTSNVFIYPDASGAPAVAPTCTALGVDSSSFNTGNDNFSVTLPTPCVLPAGTYWVSLQGINAFSDTGSDYFWTGATGGGATALYRNPGDGHGTTCTTFTSVDTCSGGDALSGFAFQVLGTVTTPVSLQNFSVD
jgi:hypothetical protein